MAEVAEDSEAFEKGLRAGDLITEAGQEKVSSVKELEARVDEAREALKPGIGRVGSYGIPIRDELELELSL